MFARVQVIKETCTDYAKDQWNLYFQWCKYMYDDGTDENGYRFIWRRPDGSLQPARGQARIPSVEAIEKLVAAAKKKGWGNHSG
ncbi:MAG: hypothetical protein JXD19_10355 [Deltaproteobacteria bacterium]|nr:hypothetical protein [Deltaproteobacteria bacterium]